MTFLRWPIRGSACILNLTRGYGYLSKSDQLHCDSTFLHCEKRTEHAGVLCGYGENRVTSALKKPIGFQTIQKTAATSHRPFATAVAACWISSKTNYTVLLWQQFVMIIYAAPVQIWLYLIIIVAYGCSKARTMYNNIRVYSVGAYTVYALFIRIKPTRINNETRRW